ncbi:aminotransferase class I/II-fold pyridoxal phosphate-dependent enzyme [Texcoconibacillus texcoconensis]|uniref:cysteine-S-conjugate beta-lyase n=1 Tax=Texcoconibacillus texcoconensis TaxID=1095777 RepID=A0A840QSH4_9BACI|nr:aminotransferase class I/II-fold pyridoxal phosphate-dependent enzyme [Texcoconibacillus texcoconensis]MBB5174462.1 cystathionine beta-lyase [Texcoconibacillus texcoconensis]
MVVKLNHEWQTELLHHKGATDPTTGAVSVPIQPASTFHQYDVNEFGEFDYARSNNPTRQSLEKAIAHLEEGTDGFAFSSGMAAISTVLMLFSQGDHLLVTKDVYGGTYRLVTEVLGRQGVDITFVDMTNLNEVAQSFRPNTKAVYIETPSNPTMKVTDVEQLVRLAKEHDCYTIHDNTFMTPALHRPLNQGVDIVVHSATKFIGGHSDCVAGLAVTNSPELAERIHFLQNTLGAVLSVHDCWLIMRGLKTLHVRMDYASKTAMQLAERLQAHPNVARVFYPGLRSHEGYDIHRRQSEGPGAVFSFELSEDQDVNQFIEKMDIPVFAVSLGAVESILSYPAKMSHASMPEFEREERGITDRVLRLSVGLEHVEDLWGDFKQALQN